MNNTILYIITVLIWGTTWFAIKLQIGHAPDEISILYRAVLAALCLVALCKMKGFSLRFKLRDHFFLCGMGLAMFSMHYLFVYHATSYVVSGIIAVVFSSVSFLSIVNNFLFFRIKPSLNITLGAFIGLGGLCIFFWKDLAQVSLQGDFLKGLTLAGLGTLIFSLGSSISKRNNNAGLEIIPSMTMGTIYGTCAMAIYTLAQSTPFVFPSNTIYWASLLYLVILGSIVAFLCYLKLIKNMGPELAGYTTVLFPIVALIVSSVLEDYDWSLTHLVGLAFVIIGNVLVMRKKPLMQMFVAKPIPSEQN
jgi:drug/metabolite transporter (DMT)-like permease